MRLDKSHALIDGEIKEYDLCLDDKDSVFKVDSKDYEELGSGVINDVCGIKHYDKKPKYFYKKIVKKKKRSSW